MGHRQPRKFQTDQFFLAVKAKKCRKNRKIETDWLSVILKPLFNLKAVKSRQWSLQELPLVIGKATEYIKAQEVHQTRNTSRNSQCWHFPNRRWYFTHLCSTPLLKCLMLIDILYSNSLDWIKKLFQSHLSQILENQSSSDYARDQNWLQFFYPNKIERETKSVIGLPRSACHCSDECVYQIEETQQVYRVGICFLARRNRKDLRW